MLPVTAHTYISAPREEIFDLMADLAYRPAWTDHYTSEFRLEHPRSSGVGAAARYRLEAPRYRVWTETAIVEADRPRRIVEATRGGRIERTRGEVVFELTRQGEGLTRVDMTLWSEPGTAREAVMERLGARPWLRRKTKVALERLRTIFEEEPGRPLEHATVAGWEPLKAPRFGLGPRGEPGGASG
ncbi:MAG: hypothetical protein QOK25_1150 [Thermoleophilaceae bacterium]|jgi:uncharacterized membrane protein|nr:hypothetical protein [Thermoleophilaceae bacterium]